MVMEGAQNHQVMSSNPDAGYFMGFFAIISCKTCIFRARR